MDLHIKFEADGTPGLITDKARADTEAVNVDFIAGDPILFLAAHRRRANGSWVKRAALPKPPDPTPEEIEARRLADREARRAARREDIRTAIREDMPELLTQLALGEITAEELRAARQAIRDRFTDKDD